MYKYKYMSMCVDYVERNIMKLRMEEAHDDVVVISREMVKPCFETPIHLRKHNLSYLDQFSPPIYFPLLFFFKYSKSNGLTISNHLQISEKLKHSLSHTLPSYYPLAGRFQATDPLVVDCNDEGVVFIHARTRSRLAFNATQDPGVGHLNHYLPMDPTNFAAASKLGALLLVQVTFFDCGGLAVGICFSHKVADFTSVMALVNSWAAVCRGEPDRISCLSFDLASYFPAVEFPTTRFSRMPVSNEKLATKRFVFDDGKLSLLREAATSVVENPTRVLLVSAFIWRIFMKVKNKNPTAACHVVNLRSREKILENVFGNCIVLAFAGAREGDGDEFRDLVGKLKSSIRMIGDEEYIKKGGEDFIWDEHEEGYEQVVRGEIEWCTFSSWCRFPVYDVDYGWGKPVWCSTAALPMKDMAVLVSSRCGQGIEAWVNTDEETLQMLHGEMKQLHSNYQLFE